MRNAIFGILSVAAVAFLWLHKPVGMNLKQEMGKQAMVGETRGEDEIQKELIRKINENKIKLSGINLDKDEDELFELLDIKRSLAWKTQLRSLIDQAKHQEGPRQHLPRTHAGGQDNIVRLPMGLKALKNRIEIGPLLEELGLEVGVEVGVQRGANSKQILETWPSCKEFHLVDLWAHQKNYVDSANVNDATQNQIFQLAQDNLAPWKDKTTFHKLLSTEAAKKFANNTFDFAYIDARHDYCGVMEDLEAYWPLIRPGGIFAGHDYLTNEENKQRQPNDDWGLCMDGTRNDRSVKGAVEDFAEKHGLTITVMYSEPTLWKSWMVQKPWHSYEEEKAAYGFA